MKKQELTNAIRSFIAEEVFSGTLPAGFNDDMRVVSTRLMDSIVTLNMVNHFEETLNIELKAHEVNVDNLDSVNIISNFFAEKAGITD